MSALLKFAYVRTILINELNLNLAILVLSKIFYAYSNYIRHTEREIPKERKREMHIIGKSKSMEVHAQINHKA